MSEVKADSLVISHEMKNVIVLIIAYTFSVIETDIVSRSKLVTGELVKIPNKAISKAALSQNR